MVDGDKGPSKAKTIEYATSKTIWRSDALMKERDSPPQVLSTTTLVQEKSDPLP